ncbi:alanine racemase [Acidipropionibacterium timonense]|uniref:alanine racemase n=1 Tax=Acidipropionibacterium timonense TaxID=2161818 RepID=UPI0010306BED|nr:alanine racemase [Acidipropionibacterium timonense]
MSFVMHVAADRWRAHQDAVAAADPDLVPVVKGNGYGFGRGRLAAEVIRMGLDTLAVGTAGEVTVVRQAGFAGDVVVLTPWRPGDPVAEEVLTDPRVIATISRVSDARAVAAAHPGARVILEVLTSMQRFGLRRDELAAAVDAATGLQIMGWTIHLPMVGDHLDEATELADAALSACSAPLWVSHLGADELAVLRHRVPVPVRHRVGTELWLGEPGAVRYTATVLDVHEVAFGDRVGYWQRRVQDLRGGLVVVVDGGTSHGVALSAPTAGASMKQQLVAFADGFLKASKVAVSPFTVAGRKRLFVEPPHMQSSLVWVPAETPVTVGDEVEVTMRATTATPDVVVLD